MIRIAIACALVAATLACVPQPGDFPDSGSGGPTPNLGTSPCKSIIDCENECNVSNPTSACFSGCISNGPTTGQTDYENSLGCGQQVCAGMTGMTARCMLDTSSNTFVDVSGGTAGDCNACLHDALARMFGTTCSPPTDPYCNPSTCTNLVNLCFND